MTKMEELRDRKMEELRKRVQTLRAISKYPVSLRGTGIEDQIAECEEELAAMGATR